MILLTLFIDAIFTNMGRFTFRALHFDFLHSYLYYATPLFPLPESLQSMEPEAIKKWIGTNSQ
jgi:predicted Zn-dependent peptidase